MELEKYLKIWKLTQNEFAKNCKMHVTTINNYLKGRRRPCLQHSQVIFEKTQGKVTPTDLLTTWERKQKEKHKNAHKSDD